jgi:LAO/AO transport system kinase
MPAVIDQWADKVRAGDVRAISRAVTAIENRSPEAREVLRQIFPFTGNAYRVGITGAPGTGKSTLVDRLTAYYRAAKQTVGIIAVDPSSPFTGGAILGDRIRMQGHATDSGIFIRSMATRGTLGGLAQATGDAALLLDAAGKQMILIETVGVGQAEIEIVRLADCTIVVLIPGMGDDVQNLKAGLMEIADIFVLNKSDREGAGRFEQQLRAILELVPDRHAWKPPIVLATATENEGIAELAQAIELYRKHFAGVDDARRKAIAHWKGRLVQLIEERVFEKIESSGLSGASLDHLAAEVADRKIDPYAAVEALMARAGLGESR